MGQEIWEADSRFKKGMTDAGFCHYIYDDRSFLEMDGGYAMGSGLGIYSKHQILDHAFMNFAAYCGGDDCMADKGVIYVKIKKGENLYHIFNTHTNANVDKHEVRRLQYKVIRKFIDSKKIPLDEFVIIGGDLNEDKLGQRGKYDTMLNDLNAGEFSMSGKQLSSFDPVTNDLAGEGPSEALDFILYDKLRKLFLSSDCQYLTPEDLSDHYPIRCNLTVPEQSENTLLLPTSSKS